MSKPDDDELRALWRSQNEKEPPMSLESVMKQETRFTRTIKWRNAGEYLAGAFVVVTFTRFAFGAPVAMPMLSRVGCLAIVAGTLVALARIRRRGTPSPGPSPEAPTRAHLTHYRGELIRQRNLLAEVPRWYLAPFAPGMLLFFAGIWIDELAAGVSPTDLARHFARPVLVVLGIFAAIAFANHRGAKKLTRQIEALGDD